MKKSLLFAFAAVLGLQAQAVGNQVLEGIELTGISPDGKIVAGETDGNVTIINLETNEKWVYETDGTPQIFYSIGQGNFISNAGILTGSSTFMGDAAYWENGQWHFLPDDNDFLITLRGITPDGNMIVGSVGVEEIGINSGLMTVPAYWTRNEDGSWNSAKLLPHPDVDFTGRVPQYISAFYVSNDGNVIAGQVKDFSGFYNEPIVYTRGEDGEWTYTMIGHDLINKNDVVFPELPEEGPMFPSLEEFMTAAEMQAYEDAVQAWNEEGTWDYSTYPDMENYASDEAKALYNAAMAQFEIDQAEFEAKQEAFYATMAEVNPTVFVYNNVFLSSDGKKYLGTSIAPGEEQGGGGVLLSYDVDTFVPVMIDVETKEATFYDNDKEDGLMVSSIADDYTFFATAKMYSEPVSYVFEQAKNEPVSIIDYMSSKSQSTAEWMEEFMVHDILTYVLDEDYNYTEVLKKDVFVSGPVFCTPDLKKFVSFADNLWDANGPGSYSYVFEDATSGVTAATAVDFNVEIVAPSVLKLTGVKNLKVYEVNGMNVFDTTDNGVVDTGLAAGIYIVKAESNNGETLVKKVVM